MKAASESSNAINIVLAQSYHKRGEEETYVTNAQPGNETFPMSDVSNPTNAIQFFIDQDNALFLSNSNVFQTEDGDIYYACIGTSTGDGNNGYNKQDQLIQFIPQNLLIQNNGNNSNKDYSTVNFISDPSVITENFYSVQNFQLPISSTDDYQTSKLPQPCPLCTICSLTFSSKRSYLKHMLIHENDREFKCSWCKLSYNYDVNLLVHIAIIHPDECVYETNDNKSIPSYKCPICACLFNRKKALQGHCLVHQVDEELFCEHCSTAFKSKVLLNQHLNDFKNGSECRSKVSVSFLRCKICQQVFDNVGHMKKHYMQFHPKKDTDWMDNYLLLQPVSPPSGPDNNNPIEENSGSRNNKRKSSKVACQSIKLYARGKSPSEANEPVNKVNIKRGRPKKVDKSSKSSGGYNCSKCSKSFKTPILLRRHEVTHTGIKAFECSICKKRFTQKSSVKIHMAVHDSIKAHQCPFCFRSFTYEHNMNTHIKVIHKNIGNNNNDTTTSNDDTVVKGNDDDVIVDNELNNSEIKKQQMQEQNQENNIVINSNLNDDVEISQYLWNDNQPESTSLSDNLCYQPNQVLPGDMYTPSTPNFTKTDWDKSSQQLSEQNNRGGILLSEDVERVDKETGLIHVHEVIKDHVTGFKRFRCRFCFKLFKKAGDLSRHVRMHTQQRPFQCYLCHKSFRLKSVLKNHFKSHWKLKEFVCETCGKCFNLKQTLRVHRRLHNPEELRFSCKFCDRKFNTAFHFKYHQNYSSCYCQKHQLEKTVDDDDELQQLLLMKPLVWDNEQKQDIVLIDNDEGKEDKRPFKCDLCGKSYKLRKYLQDHWKDHLSSSNGSNSNSGKVCNFCDKLFVTVRSLQQHIRTQHLNRQKYSCSKCSASFKTNASLVRHDLVHSNSKPYACPLCLRRFKAKTYCDRHIRSRKCSIRIVRGIRQQQHQEEQEDKSMEMVATAATQLNVGLHDHDEQQQQNEMGQLDCEILNIDQPVETYSNFRLEDLDLNGAGSSTVAQVTGQSASQNILVTNYVDPFVAAAATGSYHSGSDKYVVVSLEQHHHHKSSTAMVDTGGSAGILIDDGLVETTEGGRSHPLEGFIDGGSIGMEMASIFTVQAPDDDDGHYFYQQQPADVNNKESLADKFPILRASLFSDDDDTIMPTKKQQPIIDPVDDPDDYNKKMSQIHPSMQPPFYHGCANCDKVFRNSEELVQHVRTNHEIRKDFVCNVCHRAFSAKLSLWAHSKTHEIIGGGNGGGFLSCIGCRQQFISVSSLSRHVRMQHNDNLNLYRCSHCDRVYKTTRELDSHIKQLLAEYDVLIINGEEAGTGIQDGPVIIESRDESMVELDDAQIDEIANMEMIGRAMKPSVKELIKAVKEKTRPLLDTTGGGKAATPNDGIEESLTHPYSCSVCQKGFSRASNMQQHLSVHTEARPFQCAKCNSCFRHRCSLKTHEAAKHNVVTKLLRCHLCQRLLRSQIALRNHMRLHLKNYSVAASTDAVTTTIATSLQPQAQIKRVDIDEPMTAEILDGSFRCCFCEKSFSYSSDLVRHLRTVHQQTDNSFSCPLCNIVFSHETSFMNHQISVHNNL